MDSCTTYKVYEPLTAFIFNPLSKMRTRLPHIAGSIPHRNNCMCIPFDRRLIPGDLNIHKYKIMVDSNNILEMYYQLHIFVLPSYCIRHGHSLFLLDNILHECNQITSFKFWWLGMPCTELIFLKGKQQNKLTKRRLITKST
jgi:hypothetical protein